MTWKDPNLIIGNIATGDYYFRRHLIEQDIIAEIDKGNHVLVAAPRRVGKTSVLAYLCDNCKPNWKCIYDIVQGLDSEVSLYKRMYELILSCLKRDRQLWEKAKNYVKGVRIREISKDKIKIEDSQLDYIAEINKIIPLLPEEIKIVLFLDELPEVLHQLNKNDKKEEANRILKNLRRWRQNPEYNSLCLVVTGSIGLHHIVADITGRVTDNNDYAINDFEPFNYEQGFEFIEYVTKDATITYNDEHKLYLLDKINYKIPYFINLIIDGINKRARKFNSSTITTADIDKTFDNIVRESKHFIDWKKRLFTYFKKSNAIFMNEVLILIAHKNTISKRQVYDLAVKHDKTIDYMEFINILIDDGYIVEQNDDLTFRSPFLQAFWLRDNPIINE